MYYVFVTLLLGVLIASLGIGFALGSRLPELDREERAGEPEEAREPGREASRTRS